MKIYDMKREIMTDRRGWSKNQTIEGNRVNGEERISLPVPCV